MITSKHNSNLKFQTNISCVSSTHFCDGAIVRAASVPAIAVASADKSDLANECDCQKKHIPMVKAANQSKNNEYLLNYILYVKKHAL